MDIYERGLLTAVRCTSGLPSAGRQLSPTLIPAHRYFHELTGTDWIYKGAWGPEPGERMRATEVEDGSGSQFPSP